MYPRYAQNMPSGMWKSGFCTKASAIFVMRSSVRPISFDGLPSGYVPRSAIMQNGICQVKSRVFARNEQFDTTVLRSRRFFSADAAQYKEDAFPASSTQRETMSGTEQGFASQSLFASSSIRRSSMRATFRASNIALSSAWSRYASVRRFSRSVTCSIRILSAWNCASLSFTHEVFSSARRVVRYASS